MAAQPGIQGSTTRSMSWAGYACSGQEISATIQAIPVAECTFLAARYAMPELLLPGDFPFPNLVSEISDADAMFDGSAEQYLAVGLSALHAIETALDGRAPARILDLPCGHGRVTRMLRARFPGAAITVSDIDADGVAFASSRFGARGVISSGGFRDLDLGDRFDLIWVGSLITHLPEELTRQLLDCLVRHMAPGASLLITSAGSCVAEHFHQRANYGLTKRGAEVALEDYRRYGYGYGNYPGGRNYGISLISREWISNAFRHGPLRIAAYIERGWNDHQDVVVLRPVKQPGQSLKMLLSPIRARSASPAGWFEAHYTPRPSRIESVDDPQDIDEKDFDDGWYLATYPDVADAVQQGSFRSAREHYRSYGRAEGRLPRAKDGASFIAARPAPG